MATYVDALRTYADTGGGAAVGYRRPTSRQPKVIDQLRRIKDWRDENSQANAQHLEDLGTLAAAGMDRSKFNPQQKQAFARAGEQVASGMDVGGITTWHGTPHRFNKFDPSKVGSGEGAQVYGHGLYLAEEKAIAERYARDIAEQRKAFTIGGAPTSSPIESKAATYIYNTLKKGDKTPQEAIESVRSLYERLGKYNPEKKAELDEVRQAIERIGGAPVALDKNVLKVDLPDQHVAGMLNWDKPMARGQQADPVMDRLAASQDPYIRAALDTVGNKWSQTGKPPTTSEFLSQMRQEVFPLRVGGDARPSAQISVDRLGEAGIPGVRYADQFSRDGHNMVPTSNFVVFPQYQDTLSILERNGESLQGYLDALRK